MSASIFVDTNVLVCARDLSEGAKQERAAGWMAALWRARAGRLSRQVLHEYYTTVTMKLDPGLSVEAARADVRSLEAWRPVAPSPDILEDAWRMQDRFELSFWDGLIVAAARTSGAARLLTEELQAGQDLDGVLVVDPFASTPEEILAAD